MKGLRTSCNLVILFYSRTDTAVAGSHQEQVNDNNKGVIRHTIMPEDDKVSVNFGFDSILVLPRAFFSLQDLKLTLARGKLKSR